MQILKASKIEKSFSINRTNDTSVLKSVSLEVNQGEFVALMGPSGVGKSTLLYILGSLDNPDKGEIELITSNKSYQYSKLNSDAIAEMRNKEIGFIFQYHHLLPEFTALENVMMPAMIAGTNQDNLKLKAKELLERVGVSHREEHKPMELSGGEQQRVAIARALINSPSIVFADEPTGNLDTQNSEKVLELIESIRQEYGLTFVVATHSLQVAEIADRVLQMKDGKIIS